MTATAQFRGQTIVYQGGWWRFSDTGDPVNFEGCRLPCRSCGMYPIQMCVTLPAHLSHTGKERRALKPIDYSIASLVGALNAGGIQTDSSCCGHGESEGWIGLRDGRALRISASPAKLAPGGEE